MGMTSTTTITSTRATETTKIQTMNAFRLLVFVCAIMLTTGAAANDPCLEEEYALANCSSPTRFQPSSVHCNPPSHSFSGYRRWNVLCARWLQAGGAHGNLSDCWPQGEEQERVVTEDEFSNDEVRVPYCVSN